MAGPERAPAQRLSLLDAVDHLLNRGVVLVGETTLSLAGVDLVYLGLNVVLSSVATLGVPPVAAPPPAAGEPTRRPLPGLQPSAASTYSGLTQPARAAPPPAETPIVVPLTGLPDRVPGDAGERPERGLARLVLALIELLRQLLERQALRRIESGTLSDDEVERLGETFMKLAERMEQLKREFGLTDEDLNLSLGPLGDLM